MGVTARSCFSPVGGLKPETTVSIAVSKKLGLSTSDGAYIAQTSISVPTVVVSRYRTVFFSSTFQPIDFFEKIVTPLSLEGFV